MPMDDLIPNEPNQVNEESEFKKLIKDFFDKKNTELKTELRDNEIKELARIITLAKILNLTEILNFVKEFMVLRISLERKSRQEFFRSLIPVRSGSNLMPELIDLYGNALDDSLLNKLKKRLK